MKRYLLIGLVVIFIILLTYFGMWFFLCQTFTLEISSILHPEFKFQDNTQKIISLNQKFINKFLKRSGKFEQKVYSIINKYNMILSSETNNVMGLKLLYWSELLDTALERADYAQKTVPLGFMKKPLSDWMNIWTKNKDLITSEELKKNLKNKAWIYKSILAGKKKALEDKIFSGDLESIAEALEEIEKTGLKSMKETVYNLFSSTTNTQIKTKSVRALIVLGEVKTEKVKTYVNQILESNTVTADFIDIVANLKLKEFLEPISKLTNSKDPLIKDAAYNAFSRLSYTGR